MPKLMEGKTAIVLGVWNKWSIAYAIAEAFVREGANLLLTYQNERAKLTVEELGKELGAAGFYPCDVQQQEDIDRLAESLQGRRAQAGRDGAQPGGREARGFESAVRQHLARGISSWRST